jgi:hypothetical protein
MGPPSPLLAMGKGKPLHPHDPAAQGPRWLLWYLVQYLAEGERSLLRRRNSEASQAHPYL